MKQIVCGLGNPGKEYQSTRHNAGFLFIEKLCLELTGNSFQDTARLQSRFSSLIAEVGDTLLVQPQTFMNDSGRAVHDLFQFYDKEQLRQAAPAQFPQLWVAYDDLDLQVGQTKLQFATGPKVHNGLQSIRQHLSSEEFWHLRIGVDGRNGDRTLSGSEYVLSGFRPEEKTLFEESLHSLIEKMQQQWQK